MAAEAAQCASEQGMFWEYHDKLFANQRALQVIDLRKYAVDLDLDAAKFNTCLQTGKYRDDIKKDMAEGKQAGITGTPAFLVNGRFLSGAQPFAKFKAIIDEELDR